jgi:hypothetical protein
MKDRNNPVAKHARGFNTARAFRDRKNDYQRKTKHKRDAHDRIYC